MGARILVVAGHDSSAGAGVDADREAARAFGARALAVVTAWTVQEGGRVLSVEPREPATWLSEARAALARAPDAVKSGLLPGAAHVRALAELVRETDAPVVVDPVLAASGGEELLDEAGRVVLLETLLPLGVVLTPNLPETARLAGVEAEGIDPQRSGGADALVGAACSLLERGARAVVVKGGHGSGELVRDLVCARGGEPRFLERPRVPAPSERGLHGSGCRFATALACALAAGADEVEAAERAGAWVAELIRGA